MRTINIVSILIIATVVASLSANRPTTTVRPPVSNIEYCPVAAAAEETNWDSEYTHCKICRQGVLLPDRIGVIRCTFCGKPQKKEIAAN